MNRQGRLRARRTGTSRERVTSRELSPTGVAGTGSRRTGVGTPSEMDRPGPNRPLLNEKR